MGLCNENEFQNQIFSRRQSLKMMGSGFGMLALNSLLAKDNLLGAGGSSKGFVNPYAPKAPHFAPKAKSIIWLFQEGGPSGFDTFDPKPALDKYDGMTDLPGAEVEPFFGNPGPLMKSPYSFKQHGESGTWVCDKMPHTAKVVDELCLIKAVHCESNSHAPAMYQMNTGMIRPGFPSTGSWLTWGLGSESENLPAFVVMPKSTGTKGGALNWGSGFLPGAYQGTLFRAGENPILNLDRPQGTTSKQQRKQLDLLRKLNEAHYERNPAERDLEARIASYELAYNMQFAATDAVDLALEDEKTKELYGIDQEETRDYGSKLLLARRLVERGVRFIQCYPDDQWDAHSNLESNHTKLCGMTDKPVAGLIMDLKRRGLLDSTLVIWGGEFGRLPHSQGDSGGRDHNPEAFLLWMAGGGVRPGFHYGETDEIGFKPGRDTVSVQDIHATILHLFGFDHEKLTYRHNGRDFRLTDVSGHAIHPIIA
ncbi:MAG: DUF1501 domain-containing protein [Opitutales bacterium]